MKKALLILVVSIISIGMAVTFSLTGCKGAVEEAVTEAVEEVEEAVEEVEEAVEEDMDEIDPWILERREVELQYMPDSDPDWTGFFGENPVYDKDLVLTKGEVEEIKNGDYKVAICWNDLTGEYSGALLGGVEETVEYLGMELVATTDANFDAAKQKSDVETILALEPDIVVGYPVDLATGAEIFQPVLDAGVLLVFVSNRLGEYEHGKDFVGNSTMDPYGGGYRYGKMMVEGVDPDAGVGILTADFDYFVLNKIDEGSMDAVKELGPDLTVYEEKYVDYNECGPKAAALVQQHTDIQAFCTTWFDPALAIAADLRAIERTDIEIYTAQVNVPVLMELLAPDGLVKGLSSDFPWNIGMNTGIMCGYGVLGKEAPEMVIVPSVEVNQDNARELWDVLMRGIPMPDEIDEALKALGK